MGSISGSMSGYGSTPSDRTDNFGVEGVPRAKAPSDQRIHYRNLLAEGEDEDQSVIFDADAEHLLDIKLVHTLGSDVFFPVLSMRFSPDGKYLATGTFSSANVYDTVTGALTCTFSHEFTGSNSGSCAVCFSPDSMWLATDGDDGHIQIWDIATKQIMRSFDGHRDRITSLDFSRDGRFLVSGSDDGTARLWDMLGDGSSKILRAHDSASTAIGKHRVVVAMSPCGQFIATGTLDAAVRIWDITTYTLLETLQGHVGSVDCVVFTPDGKGLFSGGQDQTLKHWDIHDLTSRAAARRDGGGANIDSEVVQASRCTKEFKHKGGVKSVAVSSDGRWILSSGHVHTTLWSFDNAKLWQCELHGDFSPIYAVDVSPTGTLLAAGGWPGARIWRMQVKADIPAARGPVGATCTQPS
ncbi:WD40 repeat-like protein [Leucogyrophana mollusca]|uniref:WD40 repeat-like protein n=1 Tax=Leucogyrophana mollusca TaxID=85980 RepID=A0ACB8BMS0_9AGAM|nr:WD40 repeat-like protein [Leucogyrophana mollusca]